MDGARSPLYGPKLRGVLGVVLFAPKELIDGEAPAGLSVELPDEAAIAVFRGAEAEGGPGVGVVPRVGPPLEAQAGFDPEVLDLDVEAQEALVV